MRGPGEHITLSEDRAHEITTENGSKLYVDRRGGGSRWLRVPGPGREGIAVINLDEDLIFLALLGKQYGFTGAGWREATGAYGEEGSYRSVADIVSPDSLAKVREFKKAAKAAAKR